ncbi:MAG: hypothetical protein AB1324_00225 [Candidatus Micrarchaeota archaeon]
MSIDKVTSSFSDAFEFVSRNSVELAVEFTKVELLGLALQVLVGVLVIGATIALGAAPGNLAVMAIVAILGIAGLLALSVANMAISSVPYAIVQEGTKGKKVDIISKAVSLLVPMGRYALAIIGLTAAVIGIPLVIAVLLGDAGAILGGLLLLAAIGVYVVILFFIQLSVPEVVLNKAGVMAALASSYRLVRKNLLGTIFFDVVLIFLVFMFALFFGIVNNVAAAPMLNSTNPAGILFGLAMTGIITVVQGVIVTLIAVNMFYFYWRALSTEPASPAVSGRRKDR